MHQVGQLLEPTSTAMKSEGAGPKKNASENYSVSIEAINTLFMTFARRWSHKWEKTNADPKARSVWRHDLTQLKVTDESLRVGLKKSAALEWPPSPAEFAALCRMTAEDLGLPALEAAFHEAMRATPAMRDGKPFKWTHQAVYHAAKETGLSVLATSKDADKVFARNYEIACRMLMDGEPLREIPQALPEKVSVITKEVGLEALQKLRGMLNTGEEQ